MSISCLLNTALSASMMADSLCISSVDISFRPSLLSALIISSLDRFDQRVSAVGSNISPDGVIRFQPNMMRSDVIAWWSAVFQIGWQAKRLAGASLKPQQYLSISQQPSVVNHLYAPIFVSETARPN